MSEHIIIHTSLNEALHAVFGKNAEVRDRRAIHKASSPLQMPAALPFPAERIEQHSAGGGDV